MGCPFRDRCVWFLSMPEDSIFREDCMEHWKDCLVYRVCKDSKDFRKCSKCLFEEPTSMLGNPAVLEACKKNIR